MLDGEVLQLGTPQELFERPAHTFVGYFIGSPGMNVLPASVSGREARVGGTAIPLSQGYDVTGPVEIGVRPEHTRIAAEGLPVEIDRVEDIGHHRILRARHGNVELNAILPEAGEVPAGTVHLAFDPAATHVYADGWRVAP